MRTELHALGKGTRDERRGDDGEHQLVDHEGLQRDGGGVIRVGLRAHSAQEEIVQAADETASRSEGETVADQGPQDR